MKQESKSICLYGERRTNQTLLEQFKNMSRKEKLRFIASLVVAGTTAAVLIFSSNQLENPSSKLSQ